MPARKPSPPDEKPQIERFIEAAREHGLSEDPEDFERVFAAITKISRRNQPPMASRNASVKLPVSKK